MPGPDFPKDNMEIARFHNAFIYSSAWVIARATWIHETENKFSGQVSCCVTTFLKLLLITGRNRTMVAAATIVIMAVADAERISIFPLMCPNQARSV